MILGHNENREKAVGQLRAWGYPVDDMAEDITRHGYFRFDTPRVVDPETEMLKGVWVEWDEPWHFDKAVAIAQAPNATQAEYRAWLQRELDGLPEGVE